MPVRHRALFVGIGLFVQIFACDALLVWVANRLCQQAHFSVDWRKGLLDSIPYSPLSATLFDADTGTQTADCLQISQGLNLNCDFRRRSPRMPFLPGNSPRRIAPPGALLSWRHFAGKHIPFGRSCNFQGSVVRVRYIVAKKCAPSRISKRMEKGGKSA